MRAKSSFTFASSSGFSSSCRPAKASALAPVISASSPRADAAASRSGGVSDEIGRTYFNIGMRRRNDVADVAGIRRSAAFPLFANQRLAQMFQFLSYDFVKRPVDDDVFHFVLETFDSDGASGRKRRALGDAADFGRDFLRLRPSRRTDVKACRSVFRNNIGGIAAVSNNAMNADGVRKLLPQGVDSVK